MQKAMFVQALELSLINIWSWFISRRWAGKLSSLPYANEDNHCHIWIKWENKKTKRCPRCARGTCSHMHYPYTEYESGITRATIEVDISLCLKWPCGTIWASPTQIKNTQLEALLKAILCSRKIGIKLPGSQPLSEKQHQLGQVSHRACACMSGKRYKWKGISSSEPVWHNQGFPSIEVFQ